MGTKESCLWYLRDDSLREISNSRRVVKEQMYCDIEQDTQQRLECVVDSKPGF